MKIGKNKGTHSRPSINSSGNYYQELFRVGKKPIGIFLSPWARGQGCRSARNSILLSWLLKVFSLCIMDRQGQESLDSGLRK